MQLLYLPPTKDREYVRRLLHHVRRRHCAMCMSVCTNHGKGSKQPRRTSLDALRANLLRDFFQGLAHFTLIFGALPVGAHALSACGAVNLRVQRDCTIVYGTFLPGLTPTFLFLVGADLASRKHSPRSDRQPCERPDSAL